MSFYGRLAPSRLDNLVTTSTAPFFIREPARAAQSLNSPAPSGYIIINDEGGDLVDQPLPPMSLYDFPAQEQWTEFQRLAEMLLQNAVHAEGIITGIYTDAKRYTARHPASDLRYTQPLELHRYFSDADRDAGLRGNKRRSGGDSLSPCQHSSG
ncbi:Putative membrane protein igaA homolog [Cedecea neteri]|uniref:Membrane protein igaA homolog n=1 Tax=Cedecea neteri TaxID=158822 RepID=A0A2X2VBL9_9ENTR|nr:Putative membrane protein igaA homolog [Cedecea neteri]